MKLRQSNFTLTYEKENGNVILVNTLSGAAVYLSEKQFSRYNKLIGSDYDKNNTDPIVDELMNAQFVCNESLDELLFLKNKYLASKYRNNILDLTIVPTLDCNFSCQYCFVSKKPGRMNLDVQNDIIGYVSRRIDGIKELNITYFGGEPLLAMDVIENLSTKLRALCEQTATKYTFGIITNGYLLDETIIKKLEEMKIHYMQITLDGARDIHDKRRNGKDKKGSYDKIIENIKKIPESFQVTLRINIDKENINSMDQLLDDLENANIKDRVLLNLGRIDDVGTYGDHIPVIPNCLGADLFSSMEMDFCKKATDRGFQAPMPFSPISMYCGAAILDSFLVLPDGSLQKCFANMGKETENFSNIKDPQIFHEKNLLWTKEEPIQDEMCLTCKVLPLCMGGCLIERRMNDNEPVCANWKHQIDPFFENLNISDADITNENELHWIFKPKGSDEIDKGCFAVRCGCFIAPCRRFKFPCVIEF